MVRLLLWSDCVEGRTCINMSHCCRVVLACLECCLQLAGESTREERVRNCLGWQTAAKQLKDGAHMGRISGGHERCRPSGIHVVWHSESEGLRGFPEPLGRQSRGPRVCSRLRWVLVHMLSWHRAASTRAPQLNHMLQHARKSVGRQAR